MPRKKSTKGLTDAAKVLGHYGGKKGGPARSKVLTPDQRKKIAAMGGRASKGKKKTGR